MKKVIAIAVAVTGLIAYQAKATVTINISGGDLQSSSGSPGTLLPSGALAILVADTTGTTAPTNLSSNSALSLGSDLTLTSAGDTYQIIGKWNSSAGSGSPGELSDTTGAIAGTTVGNPLFLLFFPTLTLSSSTSGAGTAYGEYGGAQATGDLAGNGSDPWLMPAASATATLAVLTADNGGVTPYSALTSTLVTPVPEPSSIALVLIGLFGAVGLVRRRS